MYDAIYNVQVDTISILDRISNNDIAPYKIQKIHIIGLDRKTYITREQFFTYSVGGVIDALVVVQ